MSTLITPSCDKGDMFTGVHASNRDQTRGGTLPAQVTRAGGGLDLYAPQKGGREIADVPPPPVWNLRAVSLIPLFYISSLVFLPSPVALSVSSFSAHSPDLFFPETSIF